MVNNNLELFVRQSEDLGARDTIHLTSALGEAQLSKL